MFISHSKSRNWSQYLPLILLHTVLQTPRLCPSYGPAVFHTGSCPPSLLGRRGAPGWQCASPQTELGLKEVPHSPDKPTDRELSYKSIPSYKDGVGMQSGCVPE